jgi:hypothetical protein
MEKPKKFTVKLDVQPVIDALERLDKTFIQCSERIKMIKEQMDNLEFYIDDGSKES